MKYLTDISTVFTHDINLEVARQEARKISVDALQKVADCVAAGDDEEIIDIVKEALETKSPLEIINKGLIPGMNEVGRLWDEGVYFLPQVVLSSDAMLTGISLCEDKMGKPMEKKRKVVTHTAEGDIHDITDCKQAERALQDSETRYRAIVEAFDGLIYVCSQDYRVEFMNERFIERTGYDGTGELCYKALHDLDYICPWCVNERVFEGETVRWEVQSPLDNRWYYVVDTPIYNTDGSMSKQAMILDITERMQAEEELKKHRDRLEELVRERTAELSIAKEQAEAANRAKSIFLANMSHELRTPLNAILGYAQILQQRPLTPDVIAALNIVQRSGEHLLTLINDILDIAKIEAGKMDLYPGPFHLSSFLRQITEIIRTRAVAKGLSLTYEALPALPAVILADEKRLRQVLLNLLGNAVKFTNQGRVTLTVEALDDAPVGETRAALRFKVEDTGIGIAPEQLERIFQPFEQVGTAVMQIEGTGLGLSISRQLVRLMGGELYAESEPGRGSVFWFEIVSPVMERGTRLQTSQPEEVTISNYKGPRRVVLVVDDIPSNRAVVVDLLQPLGFETVEAEHGQQAMEVIQQRQPDLVLLDLNMPVMSGAELVEQVRQIPTLQNLPIIAMSASVAEADQAWSLEMGCDAFLLKPVSWPRLAALLEEHLKIEWEYEEKIEIGVGNSKGDEVVLVPPPKEEMAFLHHQALRGNMRAIQERAAHLEQMDQHFGPFAARLQQLAEGFEAKAIQALIKQYMEKAQ